MPEQPVPDAALPRSLQAPPLLLQLALQLHACTQADSELWRLHVAAVSVAHPGASGRAQVGDLLLEIGAVAPAQLLGGLGSRRVLCAGYKCEAFSAASRRHTDTVATSMQTQACSAHRSAQSHSFTCSGSLQLRKSRQQGVAHRLACPTCHAWKSHCLALTGSTSIFTLDELGIQEPRRMYCPGMVSLPATAPPLCSSCELCRADFYTCSGCM